MVDGEALDDLSAWTLRGLAGVRGESLYMLVDSARDRHIVPLLQASGLETRCLYDGKLPPVLAAVAPYIVALEADSQATRALIGEAWGNAWGIFAASSLTLNPLRRHLRRFLRVTDESGRDLLFRYYDPRVLRVYLPTCTASELEDVFGPVSCFLAEADDGAALRFSRVGGSLVTDTLTRR